MFDTVFVNGNLHLDDIEAMLETGQLRSDMTFVFAEELQALVFVAGSLADQSGELGELRERHPGFA
jgi:hypothetical protein